MNERRVARRYDLALPVLVGEAGLRHPERPRGVTRDISTSGLYFTTTRPLTPGSCLELTFTLPRNLTGSNDVLAEVVGRVVRVDSRLESVSGPARGAPEPSAVGVAAHIEKYDIISTRAKAEGRTVGF